MGGNDIYFRFKIKGKRGPVRRVERRISELGEIFGATMTFKGGIFRQYTYQGLLLAEDPAEYDSILKGGVHAEEWHRTRNCIYGFSLEKSLVFGDTKKIVPKNSSAVYTQIAPDVKRFSPSSVTEVVSESLLHKVFGSIQGPILDVFVFRDYLAAISEYGLQSTFKYLHLDSE